MNVRDVTVVSDDTREVLVDPATRTRYAPPVGAPVADPAVGAPLVAAAPVVEVPPHETVAVRSSMIVSPAAVAACLASIALMLFGAVNLARAGFDAPLREPVVSVAGFQGTAVLGLIALGAGIVLLGTAFSRDRGAILFVSIIIAVAGATVAIEPSVGGGVIATEASFGVAVMVGAALVALIAALSPTVRRTTDRYAHI
jgi:hypothetical protein